eukprot:TRINITY_DN1172_c0_g1_i2.p1 TRINITY_DN1172_c0_g1~~TRINITY_DN1172_c0_g1_i2.p1  ORF type:complete len:564 (-),score=147.94 TRINITY_DN1172_c0_g1_i2:500-2107(-)
MKSAGEECGTPGSTEAGMAIETKNPLVATSPLPTSTPASLLPAPTRTSAEKRSGAFLVPCSLPKDEKVEITRTPALSYEGGNTSSMAAQVVSEDQGRNEKDGEESVIGKVWENGEAITSPSPEATAVEIMTNVPGGGRNLGKDVRGGQRGWEPAGEESAEAMASALEEERQRRMELERALEKERAEKEAAAEEVQHVKRQALKLKARLEKALSAQESSKLGQHTRGVVEAMQESKAAGKQGLTEAHERKRKHEGRDRRVMLDPKPNAPAQTSVDPPQEQEERKRKRNSATEFVPANAGGVQKRKVEGLRGEKANGSEKIGEGRSTSQFDRESTALEVNRKRKTTWRPQEEEVEGQDGEAEVEAKPSQEKENQSMSDAGAETTPVKSKSGASFDDLAKKWGPVLRTLKGAEKAAKEPKLSPSSPPPPSSTDPRPVEDVPQKWDSLPQRQVKAGTKTATKLEKTAPTVAPVLGTLGMQKRKGMENGGHAEVGQEKSKTMVVGRQTEKEEEVWEEHWRWFKYGRRWRPYVTMRRTMGS